MIKHGNISVFVPHIGCPHRCSFCDQNAITGSVIAPTAEDVKSAIYEALGKAGYNPKVTELAFFGGSFTAINKEYMLELLSAGYEFVKSGDISGIRVSTRPDAITEEILDILKDYGVTAIELGCQSLDDNVLKLNHRGHTAKQVEIASKLIKEKGFSLGLQMMTGLYGDTDETALDTAKKIISLGADTVRIYPTIVLSGTYLHRLVNEGEYKPQSVEQAVELVAELLELFETSKTKVIRVGLHSVEMDRFVVGPWHSAFGELCKSRVLINRVLNMINDQNIKKGDLVIEVPKHMVSIMIGQKKANIEILKKMGYNCRIIECDINDIRLSKRE